MKTLIEFCDREPLYNVFAGSLIKPDRVIFLGDWQTAGEEKFRNDLNRFYRLRGLRCERRILTVDMNDSEAVLEVLKKLHEEDPEATVDITGGTGEALIAAGMARERFSLRLFSCGRGNGLLRDVFNCPEVETLVESQPLSLDEIFTVHGGSFSHHGHFSQNRITTELAALIPKVWQVFCSNQSSWGKSTGFFQQFSDTAGLSVSSSPASLPAFDGPILCDLAACGAIKELSIIDKTASFSFADENVKSCLMDAGIWLELLVCTAALESERFSEVQMSVMSDWNGVPREVDEVENEIDVAAVKGPYSFFISCKTGKVTVDDLFEISGIARKFGGSFGVPMLVTVNLPTDFSDSFRRRAEQMGVELLQSAALTKSMIASFLTENVKKRGF